jgi:hypothetical protein
MTHATPTVRRIAALLCITASACGGGSGSGNVADSVTGDVSNDAVGGASRSGAAVVSRDYIALLSVDDLVRNLCTEQSRVGGFRTQAATADMNGDDR